MGVTESNSIYQVLLCQTFHRVVVGMVNPLMGRFTFMPRLWEKNDNSVVGTLDGMPGLGKLEEMRAANITHNVRRDPAVTPREWQMSAATALAALAQFKGVSRSVVRKWCLLQPEGTSCSLDTIFDLVLENQFAEVPTEYYDTLRLMINCANDQDMLSCSEVAWLYDQRTT